MLLSCPATSVPSERVFKGASQTYEGRPPLSDQTAEMLVVSKYAIKQGMRCNILKHNGNLSDILFNINDSDTE